MKKLEFETSKGKFVLVEEGSSIFNECMCSNNYKLICRLKGITEEQASEIVDSMQSGTVLGKLVTDLDNHTIEIYAHEGRNVKFISAVKYLHSLLKSKGVHLFDNPVPEPEYIIDNFGNGGICEHWVSTFQEQEQNTYVNPYIFKIK